MKDGVKRMHVFVALLGRNWLWCHCGSHKQVCTKGQERCAVLSHYSLGVQHNNVGLTVNKYHKIKKGVLPPRHSSGADEKWHGCGSVVGWLTVKAQIT